MRHRSLDHATPFVSWESGTRTREEANEKDRGQEDCVAVVARSAFSTEIDPENVAARVSSSRRRYVLTRSFPSHCFPRAISRSSLRRSGGEKGESERGFSLSLSLASSRFVVRRSRGTTTNGASSRNNRAYRSQHDPYRVNLFSCTGWTEKREERRDGASVLRYLIALRSKRGPS